MNVAEARKSASENKRYKAAVVRSDTLATYDAGITDAPDCVVELFTLIGDAREHFRELRDSFLAEGFVAQRGSLSLELLIFTHPEWGLARSIGIVRKPSNGGSTG